MTYQEAAYNEWFPIRMRGFRLQCCDCGLVHDIDFRKGDRKLEIRLRRHGKATAGARSRFRFDKEEDE